MFPLIEIKSVPIEIEMKRTDARLEYTRSTAELEISRNDGGGLQIKSRPIQLNIDTFEARNSVSPTPARAIEQEAAAGMQASQEATAKYASQGQRLLNTQYGEELITKFAAEEQAVDLSVSIRFIPTADADISWTPSEMNVKYEMDKLNFDWRINQGEFEFTPGDIEITVKQRPEVVVTYVGGPLYVPPSADPNYEPVDVEA